MLPSASSVVERSWKPWLSPGSQTAIGCAWSLGATLTTGAVAAQAIGCSGSAAGSSTYDPRSSASRHA